MSDFKFGADNFFKKEDSTSQTPTKFSFGNTPTSSQSNTPKFTFTPDSQSKSFHFTPETPIVTKTFGSAPPTNLFGSTTPSTPSQGFQFGMKPSDQSTDSAPQTPDPKATPQKGFLFGQGTPSSEAPSSQQSTPSQGLSFQFGKPTQTESNPSDDQSKPKQEFTFPQQKFSFNAPQNTVSPASGSKFSFNFNPKPSESAPKSPSFVFNPNNKATGFTFGKPAQPSPVSQPNHSAANDTESNQDSEEEEEEEEENEENSTETEPEDNQDLSPEATPQKVVSDQPSTPSQGFQFGKPTQTEPNPSNDQSKPKAFSFGSTENSGFVFGQKPTGSAPTSFNFGGVSVPANTNEPKEGQWKCFACEAINQNEDSQCNVCQLDKLSEAPKIKSKEEFDNEYSDVDMDDEEEEGDECQECQEMLPESYCENCKYGICAECIGSHDKSHTLVPFEEKHSSHNLESNTSHTPQKSESKEQQSPLTQNTTTSPVPKSDEAQKLRQELEEKEKREFYKTNQESLKKKQEQLRKQVEEKNKEEEERRQKEKERVARQREENQREQERLEKEEHQRREKERLEKEEKERLEKEEQERLERERLEKERLEKEEQERLEKEKLEREEKERLEKEEKEKERLEKEEKEKERLEKERLEKEEKEKERLEKERLEKERLEKERLEKEEKERKEKETKEGVKSELTQEGEQKKSEEEGEQKKGTGKHRRWAQQAPILGRMYGSNAVAELKKKDQARRQLPSPEDLKKLADQAERGQNAFSVPKEDKKPQAEEGPLKDWTSVPQLFCGGESPGLEYFGKFSSLPRKEPIKTSQPQPSPQKSSGRFGRNLVDRKRPVTREDLDNAFKGLMTGKEAISSPIKTNSWTSQQQTSSATSAPSHPNSSSQTQQPSLNTNSSSQTQQPSLNTNSSSQPSIPSKQPDVVSNLFSNGGDQKAQTDLKAKEEEIKRMEAELRMKEDAIHKQTGEIQRKEEEFKKREQYLRRKMENSSKVQSSEHPNGSQNRYLDSEKLLAEIQDLKNKLQDKNQTQETELKLTQAQLNLKESGSYSSYFAIISLWSFMLMWFLLFYLWQRALSEPWKT